MTVQQMYNSLPIMQRVMEVKLPIKKSYEIYLLAKKINEQRDFFIKKEKELIENYKGVIQENGLITFSNAQDQQACVAEREELLCCELLDISPVELSFEDVKNIVLSAQEIAMLDGVIIFKE